MHKITEDVVWSDEDISDHIIGSGALSYSWWLDVEQVDNRYYIVVDAEDEVGDAIVRVDAADFADEARKCVAGEWSAYQTGTGQTVADVIRKDDLDADAVDTILQMAVFGEIVYG